MQQEKANGNSTKVLFDTCFIVECLVKAKSEMSKILFSILHMGYVPLVTSTIVKELDRKMWKTPRNFDIPTYSEWFQLLWSRLIVVDDSGSSIRSDSLTIPTHFPDNLHIAAAKLEKATIISLDKKLLSTARDQGIEAFEPSKFILNQSSEKK